MFPQSHPEQKLTEAQHFTEKVGESVKMGHLALNRINASPTKQMAYGILPIEGD